ncbi:MAG TPA: hypothetical protein VGF51_07630 [Acidimicrobiales bacterium]|jgi:hypothetical protein
MTDDEIEVLVEAELPNWLREPGLEDIRSMLAGELRAWIVAAPDAYLRRTIARDLDD